MKALSTVRQHTVYDTFWQGYVDGIEFFDAKFFGISSMEARHLQESACDRRCRLPNECQCLTRVGLEFFRWQAESMDPNQRKAHPRPQSRSLSDSLDCTMQKTLQPCHLCSRHRAASSDSVTCKTSLSLRVYPSRFLQPLHGIFLLFPLVLGLLNVVGRHGDFATSKCGSGGAASGRRSAGLPC